MNNHFSIQSKTARAFKKLPMRGRKTPQIPQNTLRGQKTTMMLFKKRWRVAALNVGGSPETPVYVDKMMRHHGIDIVGITETHLRPEGKIKTDYF